jgi:hypothetical protein
MKKISMMNTTSSIGVRLISLSSSSVLRIQTSNACSFASVICDQFVLDELPSSRFAQSCQDRANSTPESGPPCRPSSAWWPWTRRTPSQRGIPGAGDRHDVEDLDHARHGAEQPEQRAEGDQGLDHRQARDGEPSSDPRSSARGSGRPPRTGARGRASQASTRLLMASLSILVRKNKILSTISTHMKKTVHAITTRTARPVPGSRGSPRTSVDCVHCMASAGAQPSRPAWRSRTQNARRRSPRSAPAGR